MPEAGAVGQDGPGVARVHVSHADLVDRAFYTKIAVGHHRAVLHGCVAQTIQALGAWQTQGHEVEGGAGNGGWRGWRESKRENNGERARERTMEREQEKEQEREGEREKERE